MKPPGVQIALLRQRPWGPGGAETTLRYLTQGLVAAGHQVTVFGAGPPPPSPQFPETPVRYIPVPVWGGKTGRLLTYALNVRRLLRQARVDLIFSLERTLYQHVYRAGDGCHREWLSRRTAALDPLGRLAQRLSPFHQVLLWLENHLFAAPELVRVIANSRMVQGELSRHFQVPPEKIRVIYNGLDHRRFHPPSEAERRYWRKILGAEEEVPIILFVGSGFSRKGLPYLMQAFAGLKGQGAQLWVVGKDRLPRFQKLARRLGVVGRVRFWGPKEEVAPFYQAATLLALPTLYDPLSNVVLEALGCGLPVLTTPANGAAEFIVPGLNGEILEASHLSLWTQALEAWLERSREPGVKEAAQEAVAHLSWEKTLAQTLKVLEEAAALKSPRGPAGLAPPPNRTSAGP